MGQKRNIAIIPARSGSKGLKDKNIKLLDGIPLLAYTIISAKASAIFDEVMVSTDSEIYAEIAKEYGASIPFLRSSQTSSDTSTSWDTVREVLYNYEQMGRNFDMFTLLQPTSPLRDSEDIKNAYNCYIDKNANVIISVCEVDHSPLWCNTLPEDLSLCNFINKDVLQKTRQELKSYFRINGGIYMVKVDCFKKEESIYDSECYAYIMEKKRSVDIDDEFDFSIAETILKRMKEKKPENVNDL